MKRVQLIPAYVIHRRSYRESSFLVEVFTEEHGRLTLLARGVRKPRSAMQGLLQPFISLLISFGGRGELMTLSQVEAQGEMNTLRGECLFAGFYLNELLLCLLEKWDAYPKVFAKYQEALSALQTPRLEQKVLRAFEKCLLEELGYGILPKLGFSSHNSFSKDKYYRLMPDNSFAVSESQQGAMIFSGQSLLAIANEDWQEEACLKEAKRLNRLILAPLLGARQLHSRRLFMQPNEESQHEE